ncbi:MAG: hypothetical protein IH600_10785 [Bacteroidetes bacterium]|nr:hypothetical protein [Bacteroidota bacterium]
MIVALVTFFTSGAVAQTPGYYVTGGTVSNSYPLNTTSSKKVQLNYLGGEFSGAFTGQITTVYFRRGGTYSSASTYTNLTVKLGQTASSAFPSTTTFHTAMTQVYTAATTVIPAGAADTWFAITLTTPFSYDPTQGLIVQICQDSYTPSGITLRQATQSTTAYRRIWGANCAATTGSNTDKARYDFGFDLIAPGPMTYVSCTTIQPNTTPTSTGTTNQEIIGMQVVTSGGLSPLSVSSLTLSTAGSTTSNDISNAKVYYTGGSNTFAATNQFGSTVVSPSGTFVVNGSQVLGPGNNYFWLAYDIPLTASAGNVLDGQCTSINVASVPRTPTVTNPAGSRTIFEALNGIYTINPTGSGNRNFTSFTNAVNALNAVGVSGPVTFNVASATYNEQFTLGAIAGASATNTVTFNGGTGNAASRIITHNVGTSYQSVITLDGADHVKFKNLTVNSTNSTYGYGFLFTNSADYNEISDCVINLPANTTSYYHIGICASSTSSY